MLSFKLPASLLWVSVVTSYLIFLLLAFSLPSFLQSKQKKLPKNVRLCSFSVQIPPMAFISLRVKAEAAVKAYKAERYLFLCSFSDLTHLLLSPSLIIFQPQHAPASQPLHMPFPLPRRLFFQLSSWLTLSFHSGLLKYHHIYSTHHHSFSLHLVIFLPSTYHHLIYLPVCLFPTRRKAS